MAEVWILTSGEYSDQEILGVFSSKDKVDSAIAALPIGCPYNSPYTMEVDHLFALVESGKAVFRVEMARDGEVRGVLFWNSSAPFPARCSCAVNYKTGGIDEFMLAFVEARSTEHAVKIANERRAHLVATGEWDSQIAEARPAVEGILERHKKFVSKYGESWRGT